MAAAMDEWRGGMKIAFVLPEIGPGGAERVAVILAGQWQLAGHDVTLLTLDNGSVPPFYPIPEGVGHRALGLQRSSRGMVDAVLSNVGRVRHLRRAILSLRPDVAVSFIDQANVLTLLACMGTGIPVVVSERISPQHHSLPKPWRLLRRLVYPRAAHLVAPTAAMARMMEAWSPRPVAVIPNPVVALPLCDAVREPMVLAVGRLVPQKGFDLLIQAFAASMPQDWSLKIVGEGPERGALEELAVKHGVADRVSLPGVVSDLAPLYARVGIFALSSRYEGFPNALCEAMAAGVACVAVDCPTGPGEILRHGVNGLLVRPGESLSLSKALSTLSEDGDWRRNLGIAAMNSIGRLSPEVVAKTWVSFLVKASERG